jgi:endonuclease/exonuclease/phosphatase family metal-dependent hydrolase
MSSSYTYQKVKKRSMSVLLILTLIAYSISLLIPYISSPQLWFLSLIGFVFPMLFIITLVLFIFFVFKKSLFALVPFALLISGFRLVAVTFQFHPMNDLGPTRQVTDAIRVMSWNVKRWDIYNRDTLAGRANRQKMLRKVLQSNADILMFNEFFEPRGDALKRYESNVRFLVENGYKHFVFFPSSVIQTGTKELGMAVFSRVPIISSSFTPFKESPHSEGVIISDIAFGKDTVRVIVTHLESFKSVVTEYYETRHMGLGAAWKAAAGQVEQVYTKRAAQASFVLSKIEESLYPVILGANLGDIPVSNTYFRFNEELQDGFRKDGWGFGKTFRGSLPNLRFDYLFVDRRLRVRGFHTDKDSLSDHHMLVIDISCTVNESVSTQSIRLK